MRTAPHNWFGVVWGHTVYRAFDYLDYYGVWFGDVFIGATRRSDK